MPASLPDTKSKEDLWGDERAVLQTSFRQLIALNSSGFHESYAPPQTVVTSCFWCFAPISFSFFGTLIVSIHSRRFYTHEESNEINDHFKHLNCLVLQGSELIRNLSLEGTMEFIRKGMTKLDQFYIKQKQTHLKRIKSI